MNQLLPLFATLGWLASPFAMHLESSSGDPGASHPESQEQPEELGQVAWLRDHGAAFAEAGRSHKPVLLLFQEIPG